MAKGRQAEGEDISLFPFLSVLACVIGTLAMVIATIAVQSLDNDAVDAAMEYQKKEKELQAETAELDKLRDQLKKREEQIKRENSSEQKKLEDAKKKLAELLAKLEETQTKLQNISIEGPKVNVAALTEEVGTMEEELKGRREKIAQLTKLIAERKLPPKEAENSILPGGSGVGFKPSFIECDDGRIVIHEDGKTIPVRTAELNTNPDFAKMLDKVKGQKDGTLVFLIRDDGLSTYNTARNYANAKGVKNGKLPVIGNGRVDLSYFTKQAKNS
ncbi:hypothetical protein C5Y96_12590 [Blastopirellula marina]|uniref:Uncharacterized protein n=1 Tax=Blastopirellula marina TaxID=124 RepID=A0A2S8FG92_9BACT|nr:MULTISPECIES: hypothetical protein [Pirellulaceae]PQO31181.1 hypothetical protein C5Y96_12590 [Blastopirellula marina]RCS51575.1 hypothetical protein DTL36_12600 [Bremerella cremea]